MSQRYDMALGPFGTKAVAPSTLPFGTFCLEARRLLPRHSETHRATLTRNRLLLNFLHL